MTCGSNRRSFGEPRLAEPVPLIDVKVQGVGDVVEHQGGRTQHDMGPARHSQPLPATPWVAYTSSRRLIAGYDGGVIPISSSTRIASSLLVGSTTRASVNTWNTSSWPHARSTHKTW
jgi:hypothetical protein